MNLPLLLENKLPLKSKKIFAIIIIAFLIFTSFMTATDGGDFDTYLDASQKLQAGFNIYAPPFIKGLQYYYSPFFAWILTPFNNHFFLTEVCWSILSYLFLGRALFLLFNFFDSTVLSTKRQLLWITATVFMALQFILYEVSVIQVTFFLLWAIFESLHQILNGRQWLGGFILGLAIAIKLMPIVLLPYLFYRGYFKSLLSVVLSILILLLLPSITIGFHFNYYLLSAWWQIINPQHSVNVFETGIGPHSLTALLPVYLTPTSGELPFKRNLFNLNHETVQLIINMVRFVFLGISLRYLKSKPFTKETNRLKSIWEISFFILLIPLLLPHQQKYDFILAIPMICYLLYYFMAMYQQNISNYARFIFAVFILSMIFFSPVYGSSIIGKFLFVFTQHYRVLTISTLLLIPISLYCSPDKIQS